MFSTTLEAVFGVANGFALWEIQQSFRQLIIRREEQKLPYAHVVGLLLSYFNSTVWQNIPPLCKGRICRVFSEMISYSPYLFPCVATVFMRSKESFDNDSKKISRLRERFPLADFANAPGKDVVREGEGQGGRRLLELQFPQNDAEDQRSLEERIDVVNARVSSRLTRALYSVGDFFLMHIADIVVFVTLAYMGTAIYLGGNLIGSSIQALFCLLCIAEQKPFWMNPTYNEGPLYTICGGTIFHRCFMFVSQLRLCKYVAYYLNCGLFGKLWICVDLIAYISPHFFSQYFVDGLFRVANGWFSESSDEEPSEVSGEADSPLVRVGGEYFRVPRKLFTAFSCCDPRNTTNVRALEEELLERVDAMIPQSAELEALMAERCWSGTDSNTAVFEGLMGRGRNFGIFSKHVDTHQGEGKESLQRESKAILHICISALEGGDTYPLRALIDYHHDFHACPAAVARGISNLCLDLLASRFGQCLVDMDSLPLSESHQEPQLVIFQIKVLQIFQHVRDRECLALLQQVSQHSDQQGLITSLEATRDEAPRAARSCIQYAIDNLQEQREQLGTNEHITTMMRAAISRDLGLVTHFGEAYSDFGLIGEGQESPTLVVLMSKLIKAGFTKPAKDRCARAMVQELEEVLMNDADNRLELLDLFHAKEALMVADSTEQLGEDYLAVASAKPIFDPNGNLISGDCDAYSSGKRRFVESHLTEVLVELGMLETEVLVEPGMLEVVC